jgi:hypothetical protein
MAPSRKPAVTKKLVVRRKKPAARKTPKAPARKYRGLKALPGFGSYPTLGAFLAQGLPVTLRVKNPDLIYRILHSKNHDWVKKWYLSSPEKAAAAKKHSSLLGFKLAFKMPPEHRQLFSSWRARKESKPKTRRFGSQKQK